MSSDRQQVRSSGLSVGTLTIASASSLVAALVVGKLWGGGTVFGAALTPVIVAVVSEGLRRPVTVIGAVRETRAARYDPLAEGRRGLDEGDLERARPVRPGEEPERRVHRAGPAVAIGGAAGPGTAAGRPSSRRWLAVGIVTGLIGFVVAGVALTSSELVLGKSVVSSSRRTTIIPASKAKKKPASKTTTDTTPTTTTTTTPATTTPGATTPTQRGTTPQTTPSTAAPQPNSVPATPPPAQTAPAPTPGQAAPAPTTSQPAPTP